MSRECPFPLSSALWPTAMVVHDPVEAWSGGRGTRHARRFKRERGEGRPDFRVSYSPLNCTPTRKTNSSTWNVSQWIHETSRDPSFPRSDSPHPSLPLFFNDTARRNGIPDCGRVSRHARAFNGFENWIKGNGKRWERDTIRGIGRFLERLSDVWEGERRTSNVAFGRSRKRKLRIRKMDEKLVEYAWFRSFLLVWILWILRVRCYARSWRNRLNGEKDVGFSKLNVKWISSVLFFFSIRWIFQFLIVRFKINLGKRNDVWSIQIHTTHE